MNLIANIDGGSRGNPGPSAIGVVIRGFPDDKLEVEHRQYIGTATNNEAEYTALLTALRDAIHMGAHTLTVRCDSQLVVRQMQGMYKVHNSRLQAMHKVATELAAKIARFRIVHIPREQNAHADRLANEALDAEEKRIAEARSKADEPVHS